LAAFEVADNQMPNYRETELCPEVRGLGHSLLRGRLGLA
jgi:hypothetical protein